MKCPSILFASPKQGGILQSSGFLDLKSLMALNLTCKAHALDELSLIQLIENEITRNHGVNTMDEAISFWREIYGQPRLKRWLERDSSTAESIRVTRDMLAVGVRHEVMFVNMLHAIPEPRRLEIVKEQDLFGCTVLHHAARLGAIHCTKLILDLYPESECLQAMNLQSRLGWNVLYYAAQSGKPELLQLILALYSETQRSRAVSIHRLGVKTVLHHAAESRNVESVKLILSLYPTEPARLQAVRTEGSLGQTALHYAARSGNLESVRAIVAVYPESERAPAVITPDKQGRTALHLGAAVATNPELIQFLLTLLPKAQRLQAVNMKDGEERTVLDRVRSEVTRALIMDLL